MAVQIHPHAAERMAERGASLEEVAATVESGERFPVKFGRTGFRKEFPYAGIKGGKHYRIKQIEAFAVFEDDEWLVITVIVKYY